MAAAQSIGTPERYPNHLWTYVEQLLIKHLESHDGWHQTGGKSPTASLMEQGAAFSITRPCRKCDNGITMCGIVPLDCEHCYGSGQVLAPHPVVETQTVPCPQCMTTRGPKKTWVAWGSAGSGVVHSRRRRWPGIRPDELARCTKCQGNGYVEGITAAQHHPSGGLGVALDIAAQSWVAPTMFQLDQDDPKSALAIDLVYGGVGREAFRNGRARNVALWSLTEAGHHLAEQSRYDVRLVRSRTGAPLIDKDGRPVRERVVRHRKTIDALLSTVWAHEDSGSPSGFVDTLIRRAETEALGILFDARIALYRADAKAEFRILRAAKSLDRRARRGARA